MSAVNTSDKIKEESEHIDILFIGPPGLGKTKILRRATELVPGSSNAGGQYSTGKSLTAIIDKTNDNTILKLGLVPRSRGAFCAINEFGRQHLEDQDKMLDVMEERWFPFSKYGFNIDIPAPTAILASANPVNKDRWIDDDKIDLNQFPFLDPIIDRFDLVFPFHDKKTQKERDEFADKLSVIEAKKAKKLLPDYTQFLIKYIRYAKQFNPVVLTDEARIMLTEFYKKISNTGFGSPRILKTLFKLAKAIARLKLKNVVEEEDAKEVMEFYNVILVNFQKSVVISQSPKYIAYEKGVEIVERFQESGGVTLEVLFEIMCKEDKQLALYFVYGEKPLKIRDNIKVLDVYELLVKNSNIIKIGEKPIVLKWLCDPYDVCDPNKISKNIQNEEKNSVKPNENELEPGSHGSHTSHNMEEEKQKEEHEYGIKLGKDANLPIHKVTEEQFKELKGQDNCNGENNY
jgi:replicative DNA helicase Mcm